jgi:hypothetical protein
VDIDGSPEVDTVAQAVSYEPLAAGQNQMMCQLLYAPFPVVFQFAPFMFKPHKTAEREKFIVVTLVATEF